MKIVETDNYGGDYPDETINDQLAGDRFWKVVTDDYELQPGFEP